MDNLRARQPDQGMQSTCRDRQGHALRQEIARHRDWLRDAGNDRRALGFHRAKLQELEAELEKLYERNE